MEILLGYHIERDLQCPFAMRSQHARIISEVITDVIDEIERSPFPEGDQQADIEEIDKADLGPKPMVATSSGRMPKTPVTSTHSGPELEVSLPHTNPELTTPSPILGDVDCTQDQDESPPRMARELVSTLKVAQEKPKPRPKPKYH